MPASPRTPRHSRNSSAVNSFSGSPETRRFSKSSLQDIVASFRDSPNHHDALDLSGLRDGGVGGGSGMGNLADELADAFSDSGDEDEAFEQELENLDFQQPKEPVIENAQAGEDKSYLNNLEAQNLSLRNDAGLGLPSPHRKGHQRQGSAYDGSEYGSESDFDASGIPPSLVSKMDTVDSLVRRGMEDYGGPTDDVLSRVLDGLRDLGSQSSVEGSASRLITAHSALTTHLAHQTRQLHNLTFPILSPLAQAPDAETIEVIVPLLMSLAEEMPRPSTTAFNSLTALHSTTAELIQTLSYLSDTLHMSRQTTATATRRLKSAKELVAEMRREDDLREQGERWLTQGNWSERLEKRECAGVCGEVIGGFEDVCNDWRKRLLAQAESQA